MTQAIDTITLYYREGNSDKVYQANIEPAGNDLYHVTFAYGRRGSTMQTGIKTTAPVPYAQAKSVFDKLVKSKTAKGYTPGPEGTPYSGTANEQRDTGIHCQLLNSIEESDLPRYFDSPKFIMQEKHDGRRILIRKTGQTVTGINRLGLETGLPEPIAEGARSLPSDCLIDGEAVGDTLHTFDLLEFEGQDLRSEPYMVRLDCLKRLLGNNRSSSAIRLVGTYVKPVDKRVAFDCIRNRRGEGVVFKNIDAPYTPGRSNSGGSQLKFKFQESASCIVLDHNGTRRSVRIGLMADSGIVECGKTNDRIRKEAKPTTKTKRSRERDAKHKPVKGSQARTVSSGRLTFVQSVSRRSEFLASGKIQRYQPGPCR